MTQHLTDQQLTDIDGHLAAYRQHGPTGFACCSAHPVADAVPELLAEVRRLRTENERMRHELEVMYGGAFDNLPSAAVSAAVAPPTQAAPRDRIAEVLTEAYLTAPEDSAVMEHCADAVLAVLPEPTDRAAVLREAADQIDAGWFTTAASVTAELRRMADETATETPAAEPTAEDIARAHVTSLHLIGEQLATIESWFWEHLADVRDAGARQDGAES